MVLNMSWPMIVPRALVCNFGHSELEDLQLPDFPRLPTAHERFVHLSTQSRAVYCCSIFV